MATYESLIRKTFDKDKCSEDFSRLRSDPRNSEYIGAVVESALPVLGCLLSTQFRRILRPGTEEYDEIISAVPASFFEYLNSDKFYEKYYDDPNTIFSFLYGMFRYEILNTLKKLRKHQDIDSKMVNNFSVTSYFNLEASASYMEYRLFANELPEFIISATLKKIRFTENDRTICETILNSLVNSNGIPWYLISEVYNISKQEIRFFVDHVVICIREVLRENREMFDHVPHVMYVELGNDKNYESFREGFHSSNQSDFWQGVD